MTPIVPFAETCFKPIGILLLKTPDGRYWTEELWHKDLSLHLEYFPRTTLLSPTREVESVPTEYRPFEGERFRDVTVVETPVLRSFPEAVLRAPALWRRLGRNIGTHDVVYGGFVEWPIPYGWFVVPQLLLGRRRRLPFFSYLESSFWRLSPGVDHNLRKRIRASASEWATRRCLRRADLVFVTQAAYRELVTAPRTTVVEVNASWIDEPWIRTDEELAADIARRAEGGMRVVFAGRLEPEKGVRLLFDAIDLLRRDGRTDIAIDIVGTGSLRHEVEAFAAARSDQVTALAPVPYGEPFLALLRQYDLVVIPSLSQEQPRLVYDAYSQGVPVLAADTTGLRACVTEATGTFFARGDAAALADALRRCAASRADIASRGHAALAHASSLTHRAAHRRRYEAFERLLGRRPAP